MLNMKILAANKRAQCSTEHYGQGNRAKILLEMSNIVRYLWSGEGQNNRT